MGKLVPLLDHSYTQFAALSAFNAISSHLDKGLSNQVAVRGVPAILELLVKLPKENVVTMDLAVVVLAHVAGHMFCDCGYLCSHAKELEKLQLDRALPILVEMMHRDVCSWDTLYHILRFVNIYRYNLRGSFDAHPDGVDLATAVFRMVDISIRGHAILAVVRDRGPVCDHDHKAKGIHLGSNGPWMEKLSTHLQSLMNQFGLENCHTARIVRINSEYERAKDEAKRSKDYYDFGLKAVNLVMEIGSVPGMRTDAAKLFPLAATALRKRDPVHHRDDANILDMEHNLVMGTTRCRGLATIGLHDAPGNAYWYYIISPYHASRVETLVWVRKGLLCPRTTPYLCSKLRTVQIFNHLAEGTADIGDSCHEKQNRAIGFISTAQLDAQQFIAGTSPDFPSMPSIGMYAIVATLILEGDVLSPDLREYKVCCLNNLGLCPPELSSRN